MHFPTPKAAKQPAQTSSATSVRRKAETCRIPTTAGRDKLDSLGGASSPTASMLDGKTHVNVDDQNNRQNHHAHGLPSRASQHRNPMLRQQRNAQDCSQCSLPCQTQSTQPSCRALSPWMGKQGTRQWTRCCTMQNNQEQRSVSNQSQNQRNARGRPTCLPHPCQVRRPRPAATKNRITS